ncbi:hypothetical protein C1637_11960 [Chryseobacterium lactis]|uniref:Uncharacterized protein n=1 Tax=Chryseobacterium lactis TaxID=1241981 RepID=A0A3G6RR96_CHRLC|nr:hypothetical protein [Chryseobacterium lactis]AZA80757.1 hypothetical protein EG342_01980 [Chryseobacterium lactis]AZB05759.1 hypothetical protein EG341_18105 [Chryseobacterium lactis]PNW13522.1 hypothetical protein C1637_11960 [Chryseobacterium lactis]
MTIEIKNKTNWIITFITSMGLLISLFIILVVIPFISAQNTYFLTVLHYIFSVLPFIGFFTVLLYIWLWNTFGKTKLHIKPDTITVQYKNKLFSNPKTYLKKEVEHIEAKDFAVEEYKLGVRYHISWSGSTYSVVLVKTDEETRIVDWITKDKAEEIVDRIKKTW